EFHAARIEGAERFEPVGGPLRALGERRFGEVLEQVVVLGQSEGAGAGWGLGIFLIEKGARELSKVGHVNDPQLRAAGWRRIGRWYWSGPGSSVARWSVAGRHQRAEPVRVRGRSHLDGVERRALAQVVAGHEAGEATVPPRDRAQAPDDHRIATLHIERHGMAFRPVGGTELEAWGTAQDILHLREAGVALRA